MKIKFALAQFNTRLGDVTANLERHLEYIQAAKQKGVDLVIFPELSLTGYVLQDLAVNCALQPHQDDPVFNVLLQASEGIDLMVGFVHEDRRHMLICEDFWHASLPYLLWLDGADILLFASASPGRGLYKNSRLSSSEWVEHTNRAYAGLFTNFVAHANRVGYEDGLNFWGGSTIFDPDGNLVVRAPDFEEALTIAEIDLNQLHRSRARLPLLRDERTNLIQHELERILSES